MTLRTTRISAANLAACLGLLLAASATVPAALAQDPAAPPADNRDGRRLFQRFAEDAAIIPGGWIEAVFTYENQTDGAARYFTGGQFAFRLGDQSEAGLRLGFARQEADDGPDGSGIADLDVYGKYRFGGSPCAVGGLVKLATANEEEGIGTGKTDVEGFFACRGDFAAVTLAGSVGARYNGDPDPPLPEANASLQAGGAILIPAGVK